MFASKYVAKRLRKGFTITEVLVAMTLLGLIAVPMLGILGRIGLYNAKVTRRLQASLMTQSQLETVINVLQVYNEWTQVALVRSEGSPGSLDADVVSSNDRIQFVLPRDPSAGGPFFAESNTLSPVVLTSSDPNGRELTTTFNVGIILQPVCRDATTEMLIPIDVTAPGYNAGNHCGSNTVDPHSVEIVALTRWSEFGTTGFTQEVEMRTIVVNFGLANG